MSQPQILVVEDKAIIAKDIQNTLKKLGYAVPAIVSSGEKAIEKAVELQPALVLMDIRLRGELDGAAAAAAIRSRLDIPVIYLTAYAEDEILQRAKLTEPFGYILKPYEEKELDIAIQMALHKHTIERKLKQQERWLATTLDSMADAVLTTDPGGKVISLNPAAQALTGWSLAQGRGQEAAEVFKIVDEKTGLPAANPLLVALQTGSAAALNRPARLVTRDSRQIPIEAIATPIRDEADNIIGGVLIFRDISKQRQLETQQRQAEKMEVAGQLATGVAHNFNNMLLTLMGHVELAMETLPDDHPAHLDLLAAQQTARRAADLIRHLLAFTRRQMIYPQTVDLNNLIHNMEQMLRQLLPESIELVIQAGSNLGQVRLDPHQFEQVVRHLVLNARDAMPGGGKLVIQTANATLAQAQPDLSAEIPPGHYVVLIVADSGVGMTGEVLARIFEPFFTTKGVGHGTGLGLAACFGIIRQNNGFISVDSQPGYGTLFTIYLPQIEVALPQPVVEIEAGQTWQGYETILVVEDEAQARALIVRTLRRYGYSVLEAADGEAALQMMRRQPEQAIDLLITDVVMPKLGGKALAHLLKVLYPNLKTLFMSGYTDVEVVSPSDAFLEKPFTPHLLAQKVRQILVGQT